MFNNKHISKLIANAFYITTIIVATSMPLIIFGTTLTGTPKEVPSNKSQSLPTPPQGGPPYH